MATQKSEIKLADGRTMVVDTDYTDTLDMRTGEVKHRALSNISVSGVTPEEADEYVHWRIDLGFSGPCPKFLEGA